jgi:dTDP-4-dehydrorhamnose reductase
MSGFAGKEDQVYLLFGKNGWIGGMLINMLRAQGKTVHLADSRTENRAAVLAEIEKYKPTHILNAAGVTGRPNVDWCESNRVATIRANVIGSLTMADICEEKHIHHCLFATGCIFEYDDEHVIGGKGFTEEDTPNFAGSFYSETKGYVEQMLKVYPNTLTLRVRMPISDDLSPRNFITKIVKYDKVVNIPNSMTVLTEMLPLALIMAERGITGIMNFCNPGAISHNQCLALYKQYVDPDYTWSNFNLEEQAKVIVAARSNNTLDHSKLVATLPDIHIDDIHTAMEKCMQRMRANLEADGNYPACLPRRS